MTQRDVNPTEHSSWISNVVITEKKDKQQIHINIDMIEPNQHYSKTKFMFKLYKKIRYKLKGITRFSGLDLSHGFHQVSLHEHSRHISIFQTHEGLHRFKTIFSGGFPASRIVHDQIRSALRGPLGCISIQIAFFCMENHQKNMKLIWKHVCSH